MLTFFVTVVGCGGLVNGKGAAEDAIARFHASYNENKLDEIWQNASPKFRDALSKKKYDEFIGAVRRKLGKVKSSSSAGWNVRSINGNTTAVMTQKTIFENGKGTEKFTFAVDGDDAVLVGYNIQSMDLIAK